MTDNMPIFTFVGNNMYRVQHHLDHVVSRCVVDGVNYITSTDMIIYVSYPCLNLYTGRTHEMWVTREQRSLLFDQNEGAINPRMFELPKIGIPTLPEHSIEGYIRPGHTVSVLQDKGGHWWAGGRDHSVRVYRAHEGAPFRFLYPYLEYMGEDSDVWYEHCTNERVRLTLCSHEVIQVISEEQVWGHYFPEGEARTDVDIARSEAQEFRAGMRDYLEMEARLKQADDLNVGLSLQIAGIKRDISTYEKTEKDLSVKLATAMKALQKAKAHIEELETDMRKHPPGSTLKWSDL